MVRGSMGSNDDPLGFSALYSFADTVAEAQKCKVSFTFETLHDFMTCQKLNTM